jgi:hypothetical protein
MYSGATVPQSFCAATVYGLVWLYGGHAKLSGALFLFFPLLLNLPHAALATAAQRLNGIYPYFALRPGPGPARIRLTFLLFSVFMHYFFFFQLYYEILADICYCCYEPSTS